MSNLTINVGTMTVNGITIGSRQMDANRKLRVFQPDDTPAEQPQPASDTKLIVAEVLRQLRETGQYPPPPPPAVAGETTSNHGVQDSMTHWTTDPVRRNLQHSRAELQIVDSGEQVPGQSVEQQATAPDRVTLRSCFHRVSGRRSWSDDTRKQHESLVSHWERWFAERGLTEPDVRQIRSGMFAEFATWRGWDLSTRTAHKCAGYWETLLKSQLVKGPGIRDGLPPGEAVLDHLPDHGLPPLGGTVRKRKRFNETIRDVQWSPFQAEDCSRLIDACREKKWPPCPSGIVTPHQTWCAVWSLEWYYGITMEDLLAMPVACIDFDQWDCGTLSYTRKKTGEDVGPLPLPSVLRPLLQHLVNAANSLARSELFAFPLNLFEAGASGTSKSTSRLYRRIRPMYERAGLTPRVRGGKKLWFHSWRSAAVSKWKAIAPQWQEYITGHSRKTVSDISYSLPDPKELIQLVESYPVPDALTRMVATLD